jgi:hypothetical protein
MDAAVIFVRAYEQRQAARENGAPAIGLFRGTRHYSNGEIPHVTKDRGSFWWRDVLKLVDLFRGIATCKMGDDSTVLFGLMFGMTIFSSKNSQDYTHMPRTKISLWLNFY